MRYFTAAGLEFYSTENGIYTFRNWTMIRKQISLKRYAWFVGKEQFKSRKDAARHIRTLADKEQTKRNKNSEATLVSHMTKGYIHTSRQKAKVITGR